MSPEVNAAIIAGAVSLLTLVPAVYTTRKQLKEQQDELKRTLAQQRDQTLNERFATAADQLGSDRPPAVRLAGVYAMAGLADDWEKNRKTCVNVLCAYLRLPYTPEPGDDAPAKKRLDFYASREVRRTVIQVIAAHLRKGAEPSWQGIDLDFTGVVFDGGDFSGAVFSDAKFSFVNTVFCGGEIMFGGAVFSNPVSFRGALFSGGKVYFSTAVFASRDIDFYNAVFSGSQVYFDLAEFPGQVSFYRAVFRSGQVHFNASVSGQVSFYDAVFRGAQVSFDNSTFSGVVDFSRGKFSDGQVSFKGAVFSGRADFGGCVFSSGKVDFDSALFSADEVPFIQATFSGAEVSFFDATFSHGVVDFNNAVFSDSKVLFQMAEFSGGTVDFSRAAVWTRPPEFDGTPPSGVKLPPQPGAPPPDSNPGDADSPLPAGS
jgi:uncharacterized protein YjbI with pentapeptide repeats